MSRIVKQAVIVAALVALAAWSGYAIADTIASNWEAPRSSERNDARNG